MHLSRETEFSVLCQNVWGFTSTSFTGLYYVCT